MKRKWRLILHNKKNKMDRSMTDEWIQHHVIPHALYYSYISIIMSLANNTKQKEISCKIYHEGNKFPIINRRTKKGKWIRSSAYLMVDWKQIMTERCLQARCYYCWFPMEWSSQIISQMVSTDGRYWSNLFFSIDSIFLE